MSARTRDSLSLIANAFLSAAALASCAAAELMSGAAAIGVGGAGGLAVALGAGRVLSTGRGVPDRATAPDTTKPATTPTASAIATAASGHLGRRRGSAAGGVDPDPADRSSSSG